MSINIRNSLACINTTEESELLKLNDTIKNAVKYIKELEARVKELENQNIKYISKIAKIKADSELDRKALTGIITSYHQRFDQIRKKQKPTKKVKKTSNNPFSKLFKH